MAPPGSYDKMERLEEDEEEDSESVDQVWRHKSSDSLKADQLQEMTGKLESMRNIEQDYKNEYEKSSQFWTSQVSRLAEEVEAKRIEIRLLERAIEEKEKHLLGGPPPPGPHCLRFVDSDAFTGIASLVILANLGSITLELLHQHYAADLYWLDNLFLAFYITELLLKASYYQRQFLLGPPQKVWWNWLDLTIVVVGMGDLWILPLVESDSATGPSYMSYLRILRLLRWVRILKIIHIFFKSDLSWADGAVFQSFIMAVIGFNAILMGIEIETREYDFVWFYVEQLLLMIFTFELVVRLKKSGRDFFVDRKENAFAWNWLDFIIVVGGVIDQWMLPTYYFFSITLGGTGGKRHGSKSQEISQVMNLLRMARLLRILRLVRLIKNIPPLYNLVVGVAKAMQGMGWVMVLTSVVLYVCALLGVKMLGPHGLMWGEEGEATVPADVTSAFPDIFGGIFNLFKVMNADMSPMEGLFGYVPATKFIFMFYVVVTNWAIFSILTAVVSDHMARVTEATEEEAEAERLNRMHEELVQEIFDRLDHDKSGDVQAEEFKRLINDEAECAELCKESGLQHEDLIEFLEILCHKAPDEVGSGRISRQAFLKGLQKEGTTVNQRSMMRVEKRLADMEKRLASGMARLENALTTTPSPSP